MGYTIFYKMRLNNSADIDFITDMIIEKTSQLNWHCEIYEENKKKGVVIDTHSEKCESIAIVFNDLTCNGFVKYLGIDEKILYNIFDVLWHIKPILKSLTVNEDMGLWEEYKSKHTKTSLPKFRPLTTDEKDELIRNFDIQKSGYELFLPNFYEKDKYGEQRAKFFQMVRKDLSDDLNNSIDIDDIQQTLKNYPIYHPHEWITEMNLDFPYYSYVYWITIELWIIKKLTDKAGVRVIETVKMNEKYPYTKNYESIRAYSWMMMWFFCDFYGGILGTKHTKMNRLVRKLEKDGYDLADNEIFFRIVYSLLEYAGFYRPKELIIRQI